MDTRQVDRRAVARWIHGLDTRIGYTGACRVGGEIGWLGKVGVNRHAGFRWGALMGEKRIIRPSDGDAWTMAALARSYPRGDLKLDGLITRRIALEEINQGFDDLKAGRSIRSVIVFGDAM